METIENVAWVFDVLVLLHSHQIDKQVSYTTVIHKLYTTFLKKSATNVAGNEMVNYKNNS